MSSDHLHSLDALLLSVRDTESKRLTQEAVTAYQAGAYRAAILSIWVAVCADIISKLKELAIGGDAAATTESKNVETWIQTHDLKKLQQYENGLVELACDKFEMLLPHEATDLARLRDDRHLCAHPAFVSDEALFSPTPELARTHIAHAILHLLSRPPVQGKQLIARFDRDLLGGSIPRNQDEIELVLRQNYVARAKVGAVVSLIKSLARALVGVEAEKYKGKEQHIALSLAAIGRISPGSFEEHLPPLINKLGRELGDTAILAVCRYIDAEPRIWNWLGEAGQTRILAKIDNLSVKELAVGGAFKARHIEVVGMRLLTKLKGENPDVREHFISRAPCLAFVSEALNLYGNSETFAEAERFGAKLILPHAKYLQSDDLARLNKIIRKNKYDQILNSSETATILTQVFDETRHLLPGSSEHWSAISDYVVEKKAAGEYAYPQFLGELQKAGVKTPEISEETKSPDSPAEAGDVAF
jgi:hypothetical protein